MQRDAGFTLVEILVAFSIFAVVLAVVYDGLSDSLRAEIRAEESLERSRAVRSILARVGADIPLEEGYTTGRLANGTEWILGIRPAAVRASERQTGQQRVLHTLELTFSAPGQGEQTFTTRRLGAGDD